MFFCYLSFYVFVRNYTRYRTFHDIRYRSRILSDSSYLRTVTPESRQTTDPNLFDKGADSCSCWRPDDTDLPSQNANGPYESDRAHVVCVHAWFICVDRVRDLIIIHVSLSNRSYVYIKCIFVCPVSPTVIRLMKRLNRTHSRSQWLLVIPAHCGSAVADPSGFTPRLEESQLHGPQWIYSHYNNCK